MNYIVVSSLLIKLAVDGFLQLPSAGDNNNNNNT